MCRARPRESIGSTPSAAIRGGAHDHRRRIRVPGRASREVSPRSSRPGEAIVNQPDRLYHVCYRTETGFTVIDIWADEQSFAAFGETLGPAVQRAGLDAKPAVYPVEQFMTQDGTRSS